MAGGPAGGSGVLGPRPGRAWRARAGFGARVRPCGRLTRMNRLAGATSPYRLQHADNPVNTYKSTVVKKNRCVRINYAGDCHVDIVPHLILPDGRQVIVNSEVEEFEETNPEGYTAWMKEKDSLTGGNLRKVIRLVKYLRDSKDTFRIPSVILTALLGERVQVYDTGNRYSGVPTTLVHLVEDLAAWLALNPLMPVIVNPSCPQTSFNHRWDQDRYANFAKHIQSYATRMRTVLDEQDKDKGVTLWQQLFGDGSGHPPLRQRPPSPRPGSRPRRKGSPGRRRRGSSRRWVCSGRVDAGPGSKPVSRTPSAPGPRTCAVPASPPSAGTCTSR
ncbi:hypothetical protein [Streptomyces sp. NPDC002553]|uniref:SMODS domain-containing nucleotidyltransferase n=1 Tax=Streptomyces sp. NPDC002553 TaxID=3154417 RepID=UPI003330875E